MRSPYAVIAAGTLVAVGGIIALGVASPEMLKTANTMRVEDFGAYWTATKVNQRGSDAYRAENLLPLQQEIEPDRTEPLAAWSPPWTSAVMDPLARLDYAVARWAWRFLQIATLFLATTLLWRTYGGAPERLIWMWCCSLAWYPSLQMLGLGQHSNLVLLGAAGWIAGLAAGCPFLAGMMLSLTLVKPQNLYLLGLLAAVWAIDRRQWQAVAGGICGTIAMSVVVAIQNPDVFTQYFDALGSRPPTTTIPPTIGMLLRLTFGWDRFWLSFLPPAGGLIWAAWYYLCHRADWDWSVRGPLVVLVSCITSPYGWVYDQVLFLIPLAVVLSRLSHRRDGLSRGVMAVIGLTGVCLLLHQAGLRELTFVWLAPLCLTLYLLAGGADNRPSPNPPGTASDDKVMPSAE